MKTIKNLKKSILLVALTAASLGYANETTPLVFKKDLIKTSLVLKHVNVGELISIKDNSGLILYKEIIKNSETYSKGFDLTALPDGNYFFELDGNVEIKTIPFIVKSNHVVFDNTKETSVYKPVTELDENLLLISKSSDNLDSMKIELYYEGYSGNFELINSETIENTKFIKRIYRLSDNKKGKYKIVYYTSDKEFTKHINF
jgi:hypothetical protein